MAGKRGRKPKEPEVVEEVNDEQNVQELPKKKRGRPNPKSEDKAEPKKKSGQSKADKVENNVDEEEIKEEEEMEEEVNPEAEESDDPEIKDVKEIEDDDNLEENDKIIDDEVEEKPKRGRGRQKKDAPKETKDKPATQRRGRTKNAPKYVEGSDSNDEAENNKDDKNEEEKDAGNTAAKKKGRGAKTVQKNGDSETSPKRTSGRNANKKVASYAEESENEEVVEVKSSKRGRNAGRSKKDDAESKKLGKEVRVVLEHCKSCQVYRRNAVALKEAFERAFDDIDVCINPENPRRGSFECVLLQEDGSSIVLWSGIDKGPPRKLKFPDHQDVITRLQNELKM